MNTAQLAALIAAVFFAAGVCVAAYALIKLARLLTEAIRVLTGTREQTDLIVRQAQAAIDRTNQQLDRTDAITANMNEVSANVAELTEHVSALAGLGRALATGPVGRVAAVAYGVRHAVGVRRGGGVTGVAAAPAVSVPGPGPVPGAGDGAAGRPALRAGASRMTGRTVR